MKDTMIEEFWIEYSKEMNIPVNILKGEFI